MKKKETIFFVAEKSGEQLIPALTIAQKIAQTLVQQYKEINSLFFTKNSPLDIKIIKESTIKINNITLCSLRFYPAFNT